MPLTCSNVTAHLQTMISMTDHRTDTSIRLAGSEDGLGWRQVRRSADLRTATTSDMAECNQNFFLVWTNFVVVMNNNDLA